ncbi:MAG: hypothetical protein R3F62_01835 [Planctomycetota bacterium]
MSRYVLDLPAALRLIERARPLGEHRLLGPTLLRSQVLDALFRAVLAGELEEEAARERLRRFDGLKLRFLGDAVLRRRAWELARRLGWDSTLRAEYVALAQLQADALITPDRAFARSLQGVVETAPLSALDGS